MTIASIILCTFFMTLFGFIRIKELAALNMLMAGITLRFFGVNVPTILQQNTLDWIRGRVFAVLTTTAGGLMPVGMGLTGVTTDLLDRNG